MCLNGVLRVFQRCFEGVLWQFQFRYFVVTSVLNWCFIPVLRLFQICSEQGRKKHGTVVPVVLRKVSKL